MSIGARLKSLGFDTYLLLLVGMVVLASLLPARGIAADIVGQSTTYAVALLFFIYGARLDTASIMAGLANWRLQGMVLATTFIVFPIVGIVLANVLAPWLPSEIVIGLIYVSILPSTVQSSIAFTSVAQGNVPAAVCAASVSNLLGVFVTPILAGFLVHTSGGGFDMQAVIDIGVQLLLPFAVGQLLRPWIGAWIKRHTVLTRIVDRGSILLIVYSAFSAGVVAGIWGQVDIGVLALMIAADIVMLAIIMVGTFFAGRAAGMSHADAVVLLFCGSKKSLASGLPMANILFAGRTVGLIVLPLMLFHQIQLIVCAVIAQRYAYRQSQLTAATPS
jgi:sodium/bile acid cotransporter 7